MSINCSAGHISLTAYLRCFLAEALPATIDRVIYLDCDMLVLDSLKELCGHRGESSGGGGGHELR